MGDRSLLLLNRADGFGGLRTLVSCLSRERWALSRAAAYIRTQGLTTRFQGSIHTDHSGDATPKWGALCLTVHRASLKYLRVSKKLGETLTAESILQKSPKVYGIRGRLFEEGKRRLILSYVVRATKLISLKPAVFFCESSSSTECLNIPFC